MGGDLPWVSLSGVRLIVEVLSSRLGCFGVAVHGEVSDLTTVSSIKCVLYTWNCVYYHLVCVRHSRWKPFAMLDVRAVNLSTGIATLTSDILEAGSRSC